MSAGFVAFEGNTHITLNLKTIPMIHHEKVSKIFGSGPKAVTAVNDVTMAIEKGNLVTLLGPSGCGKTALLRLTKRLIPLTRGTIKVRY